MGAYVKSEVSGLWNVACGWAQMFGKSQKSHNSLHSPFHVPLRTGDMERGWALASL